MKIEVDRNDILEPFVVMGSDIVYGQRPEWFNAHWRPLKMSLLRSRRHFDYDPFPEKVPAIVFIPGGGFVHTDRNALAPEMVWFAKHGFAVFSLDYSTTAKTRFPMQIEDIKQGIRYIRKNADMFGVDEERIHIMGESSGAYLAAYVALTNGDNAYEKGEYLEYSSDVRSAVVMYPVVTPERMYKKIGKESPLPDTESYPDLCGMVSKDTVPFMVLCGEMDDKCPLSESEAFYSSLEEKGAGSPLFVLMKNTNHADLPLFQDSTKRMISEFFINN